MLTSDGIPSNCSLSMLDFVLLLDTDTLLYLCLLFFLYFPYVQFFSRLVIELQLKFALEINNQNY